MTRQCFTLSLLALLCLGATACDKAPDDAPPAAPTKAAPQVPAPAPKTIEEIPKDQSGSALSEGGHFFLTYTPSLNPIPFQKLFSLDVKVFDAKDKTTALKGVSLDQVRATMPAHKHGMNVEPSIKKTGDGAFLVEGMRFHMKGTGRNGYWLLEFVLNDGKNVDTVKFDLQCCR